MSDVPEAPGWWQASDGRWYPPEQFTGPMPAPQGPPPGYDPAPDVSQPGFPQPAQVGYGYGVVPPKNETLAVVSLVLGCVSVPLLCLCGIFGIPIGLTAVITGILGRRKIRESAGTLTGEGMALAGIIVGAITIALSVVVLAVFGLALFVGNS